MNNLKQIWYDIDGKKTIIGTVLLALYSSLVATGNLERNIVIETLIGTIFGVGVSHKVVKKARS